MYPLDTSSMRDKIIIFDLSQPQMISNQSSSIYYVDIAAMEWSVLRVLRVVAVDENGVSRYWTQHS